VVRSRANEVHEAEFHLDALTQMGIPIVSRRISIPITADDRRFADDFFRATALDNGRVVALNPSGGWPAKKWPLTHFSRLGDRLVDDLGARIIVLWGPGEEAEAQRLVDSMKRPALMIPATNLKQLGAILERCSAVVSNDSGPMHIAAAVGAPTVGIFGPTDPAKQGPYGPGHIVVRHEMLDCLACDQTSCEDGSCMADLPVDRVLAATVDCLRKNNRL